MSNRFIINVLIASNILVCYAFSATAQDNQENLGQNINSKYNELDPVLSPDGGKLYFTRTKHPDNVGGRKDPGDIWVADLDSGQWSEALNLGTPVNTDEMNAVIGFSGDGKIMYMQTQNKRKEGSISFSRRTSTGWSKPQIMRFFSQ